MASIGSGSGRRKSAAIDAELRSGLVSNLVDDSSDSDTDLDLPNPGTLLSPIQGRVESGAPDDSEVQFVPETPPPPPLLLLASTMDTPLLRTPGSPRGKVAATYSAKGTPRARRSLGSALAARGRPALESAQLSTGNGSSSLTAVDDSGAAEHTESTPSARRTPKKRRPATAAADSPLPATPKRQKTLRGSKPDKPAQPAEQKTRTAPKDGDGNGPELRLLCTGLSEAQMTRVQRAAKQAQQHFASSVAVHRNAELLGNNASGGGGYTHVVAATGKDGRATRTFKYLAGLVSGAWVVTADWLLESVKAHKRLPEADFAVAGDSAMPQSTLVGPRPVGTLLRNYMVHLWGDDACWDAGSAHSPADMRALVVATGASVVEELASPGSSEDEDGGDSQPALTSKSRESVGAGVRHPGSRVEKEVAGLPAKYRRLFDLPAHEGQPIILVSGSDLSGARSSVALGAIISATGGTTPCRTKTWLFDCISAGQIL
ncbi:hypothetical protein LPJ61_003935 [Coemansia biformis]|uniref:BRCT domain-containing protein n=1 Tax=Coemansia biformis TaxID=1286918 RepID=A0A9W7YB92_9FUNG|nr:hypothetical protein LPJ61_003935 [Coemansia biformis]